ncbi:hypothetical protein ATKI12_8760 [Kitasatospora sp. Ki12]
MRGRGPSHACGYASAATATGCSVRTTPRALAVTVVTAPFSSGSRTDDARR